MRVDRRLRASSYAHAIGQFGGSVPDFYDLLGVSSGAEPEVISAAYRALAKKHHPDVNRGPGAQDRLAALNEAYEILRDPAARRAYDAAIRRGPATGPSSPIVDDTPATEPARVVVVRRGSLVGNVVYLLVGVPVIWTLAMLAAHVLLTWIGTVLLDWAGAGEYSMVQAVNSLGEIIRGVYDQVVEAEPARQDVPVSFVMTALGSFWLFICSGAATAGLASHAREERAGLPMWTVALVVILFFGFLTWRRLSGLTSGASLDFRIDACVTQAAVLAGIVFGLRSDSRSRSRESDSSSAPTMAS